MLFLHQENVDALINCVSKNIGYSNGKPVAAFTIYKCLLHWKSFEAERTSVFDRLIQMIGSAIEVRNSDDNIIHACDLCIIRNTKYMGESVRPFSIVLEKTMGFV